MADYSISSELLRAFFEELHEQLGGVELMILDLEKSPKMESIHELFRITHTIKGSATAVGLDLMASLAHSMESLFEELRKENLQVTKPIINLLFRCLDGLKHFKKEALEGRESSLDITNLLKELESSAHREKTQKENNTISDITTKEVGEKKAGQTKFNVEMKSELKSIRKVRVNVDLFDRLMNLVGELVIGKTRLLKIGSYLKNWQDISSLQEEVVNSIQQFSHIIGDLQEEVMTARLLPIQMLFNKFPRMIRDLASQGGKEVEFLVEGQETQLDRAVLEEISDPLIHILRNAVDHGIELPEARRGAGKSPTGKIKLRATHRENHVVVEVEDDGCGLSLNQIRSRAIALGILSKDSAQMISDEAIIQLVFTPGFSTASKLSEVSGRGVGLDIVKVRIQKIGGSIEVSTETGKGTLFKIRLPFSLAIIQGLQVLVSGTAFAIPINSVKELVRLSSQELKKRGNHHVFVLRDEVIPLVWLGEFYGESFPTGREIYSIVLLLIEENQVGLLVDSFLGNQEFVIKTMGSYIGDYPGISGATVLADGTVGLILDVANFVNLVRQIRQIPRVGSNFNVGEKKV